ncbi:MAG TPA: hypothetical protein VF472_00125 [Burkholderiaceae bacterium]
MSEAYRQSALLLHGIGETDRRWILAQLTDDQRRDLSTQLAELKELGMPPDRSLAEELLAGGVRATVPHAPRMAAAADGTGAALRLAPAQAVLQLLKEQPAWLIAAVLSVEAWPWREAIYAALNASTRERVKQATGTKLPHKLAVALVADLESRLVSVEVEAEPDAAAGRLSRLIGGFRQWIGL